MLTFENERKISNAKTSTSPKTPEFQPTIQTSKSVFRMWQLSINFLYFFGVIPYKCKFCRSREVLDLKTSKFQKVFSKSNAVTISKILNTIKMNFIINR